MTCCRHQARRRFWAVLHIILLSERKALVEADDQARLDSWRFSMGRAIDAFSGKDKK